MEVSDIYEDYFGRFVERLKKLKKKKGVTSKEMSKAMGHNESYISQIERGYKLPSLNGFFYICEYLDVPPKYFLDDEIEYPTDFIEVVNLLKELDEDEVAHIKWILQAVSKVKSGQNNRGF